MRVLDLYLNKNRIVEAGLNRASTILTTLSLGMCDVIANFKQVEQLQLIRYMMLLEISSKTHSQVEEKSYV